MSTKTQTDREETNKNPIYLDCNATTPLEPEVRDIVFRFLEHEFGNAGSRTHSFGARAKAAVQEARESVAQVAGSAREEVVFTSGATESNNIALLGLRAFGEKTGRKHIVSTSIEHKAVLEPLALLAASGFEVSLVDPGSNGVVEIDAITAALRPDTLCVSVMHVNNETGMVQPVAGIAAALADHDAYFHVDGAQGFGKRIADLRHPRIDLLSASAHKLYGPKGVGALITRRRRFERPPLVPIMVGGGQERGLRPGTLPVALIAGFGKAAELALANHARREEACRQIQETAVAALASVGGVRNGDPKKCLASTLNISFPGLDSEALMVVLKDLVAISNGSACTSSSYTESHVLKAMKLDPAVIRGALRLSWSHLTPPPNWGSIASRIDSMR